MGSLAYKFKKIYIIITTLNKTKFEYKTELNKVRKIAIY